MLWLSLEKVRDEFGTVVTSSIMRGVSTARRVQSDRYESVVRIEIVDPLKFVDLSPGVQFVKVLDFHCLSFSRLSFSSTRLASSPTAGASAVSSFPRSDLDKLSGPSKQNSFRP